MVVEKPLLSRGSKGSRECSESERRHFVYPAFGVSNGKLRAKIGKRPIPHPYKRV